MSCQFYQIFLIKLTACCFSTSQVTLRLDLSYNILIPECTLCDDIGKLKELVHVWLVVTFNPLTLEDIHVHVREVVKLQ